MRQRGEDVAKIATGCDKQRIDGIANMAEEDVSVRPPIGLHVADGEDVPWGSVMPSSTARDKSAVFRTYADIDVLSSSNHGHRPVLRRCREAGEAVIKQEMRLHRHIQ